MRDPLGLGAVDESAIGDDPNAAASYLRAKWSEFENMSPRIIDLQHRAAVAAGRAREAGDMERYRQAREVIAALGRLNVLHGQAIDRMRSVAEYVGLSGYSGLGAIPVAAGVALTGLALTVAYFFRAFAAQSRILDLIEAGVLTPEQATAIQESAGRPPGGFGELAGVARLALFAAIAYMGYRAYQTSGPLFGNPPLVVFDTNPPEPEAFGEEVYAVWYRHTDDGNNYVHEFEPGVELIAHPDGSVGLSHRRGRRVWEEF